MIYIEKESNIALYKQIYQQIREGITSGNIAQGSLLPGIRTLSKTLGVARNTVDKAYTQLAVEGYISPKTGAGFVVESAEVSLGKVMRQGAVYVSAHDPAPFKIPSKIQYDFQYGNFPEEWFPTATWKKYIIEALTAPNQTGMTQYHDKQGIFSLRRELRKYLHQTRGISCMENQIIIGCGLHYSLDILCKLFGSRKKIAMEEPGYNGAREVFKNNGFSLYSIPSSKEGINLSVLKATEAYAAYVTPSHQFPYGTVLPIYRRRELLDWAVINKTYIIEDDYDSEYRYDANPVPSLQSIDRDDRVVYIGTFSKSLSPSLRVNYMVLPNHLLKDYYRMFSSYSSPVSWLTQEALAGYLRSGEYARHVRKMCATYKKRHDVLVQEISAQFGERIVLHGRGAGLHFLLEFPTGAEEEWLIQKAEEAGVLVYSVKPFWNNLDTCPTNMLFAGYSLLNEQQIREGINRLRQVWFP